jgi:hypothetical protein
MIRSVLNIRTTDAKALLVGATAVAASKRV